MGLLQDLFARITGGDTDNREILEHRIRKNVVIVYREQLGPLDYSAKPPAGWSSEGAWGNALDKVLNALGDPPYSLPPYGYPALKEDRKRMLQIDTWRVSHAEGQSLVAKKIAAEKYDPKEKPPATS